MFTFNNTNYNKTIPFGRVFPKLLLTFKCKINIKY